jgi:hypothetical protein
MSPRRVQSHSEDKSTMGNKIMKSGEEPFDKQETEAAGRPDFESADEARWNRIAIVAYYKGQRRAFSNSGELDDWLAAEREIDAAGSEDQQSR